MIHRITAAKPYLATSFFVTRLIKLQRESVVKIKKYFFCLVFVYLQNPMFAIIKIAIFIHSFRANYIYDNIFTKNYRIMTTLAGDRLKKFMDAYRISISDLANKTGLEISNIKNILYGRSQKGEYLKIIAEHYNVPLYFFTNKQAGVLQIDEYEEIHNILIEILREYLTTHWPQELITDIVSEACILYASGVHDMGKTKAYIRGAIATIVKAKLVAS